MLKKIAAALAAMVFAVASFAAVDANKGSVADLDGLKGVGPAMSKRIVDARQRLESDGVTREAVLPGIFLYPSDQPPRRSLPNRGHPSQRNPLGAGTWFLPARF